MKKKKKLSEDYLFDNYLTDEDIRKIDEEYEMMTPEEREKTLIEDLKELGLEHLIPGSIKYKY